MIFAWSAIMTSCAAWSGWSGAPRIPLAHEPGVHAPAQDRLRAGRWGWGSRGTDEVVDLELSEPESRPTCCAGWREQRSAGLTGSTPRPLPAGRTAPGRWPSSTASPCRPERHDQTRSAIGLLLASASWPLTRRRPDRDREQTIDMRPFLLDAELTDEGLLKARLKVSPDGSVRPEELLECLGLRDLLDQGAVLARTHVELA